MIQILKINVEVNNEFQHLAREGKFARMKQTVIIADTIGKYDRESGRPFGHYLAFFKQYSKILLPHFRVVVGASPRYNKHLTDDSFGSFIPLLETEYRANQSFIQTIKLILRQLLNTTKILLSSGDIILFQAIDSIWGFIPLIFYFGKKRLYFVLYKDLINRGSKPKRWIKKVVFTLAVRRLAGIITSTKTASSFYSEFDIPVLVVPDYVRKDEGYSEKTTSPLDKTKLFDIAILGIHTRNKDLADIVNTFKNSKYKVIIAGKFTDDLYFQEIAKMTSNSENIVLLNKYISEEYFNDILRSTRYVLFPYLPTAYGHQSSGVFYDALYADKPVICTDTEFFHVVTDCKLGIVYSSTVRECIPLLDSEDLYSSFLSNIQSYVQTLNAGVADKVCNFLNCAQQNS